MPRRNASANQLVAIYAMAQTESKPRNNDAGLLVNDMRLFRSYVCKCVTLGRARGNHPSNGRPVRSRGLDCSW